MPMVIASSYPQVARKSREVQWHRLSDNLDCHESFTNKYAYDAYGRATKLTGTVDSDFGYTGHYYHAASGLNLTLYRAYDPDTGRWQSRDPIGENGGGNVYGYVKNSSINFVDSLGLEAGYHYNSDGSMSSPYYRNNVFTDLGWFSILHSQSMLDYESTLESKAMLIAKKNSTTTVMMSGLSEFHESVWNLTSGIGLAIATFPEGA